MALSNILNEPRREITETLVGIGTAAVVLVPDYYFGVWFAPVLGPPSRAAEIMAVILGMLLGVVIVMLSVFAITGIHGLGNVICNSLDRHGLHLRPQQRFHRKG